MTRFSPRRRWLAVGGTLLLATLGMALWYKARPHADDPRAGLVGAVGKRRFIEARLTGGFQFGERIGPGDGISADPSTPDELAAPRASVNAISPTQAAMRGALSQATEDWGILDAAAEVKEEYAQLRNRETRAALASAHLILGETNDAVRLFERALRDPETGAGNAWLMSDAAAAYLTRAATEKRADDYPRALEHAEHALEIDPTLREALFNRALALEQLQLPNQAIKAWDRFFAFEGHEGWRDEAAQHKSGLVSRPKPDFDKQRRDIGRALESGTDEDLDAVVRANVGIARDLFEQEILPGIVDQERRARRLANAIHRIVGDRDCIDTLNWGSLDGTSRRARLANQGTVAALQGRWLKVASVAANAGGGTDPFRCVYASWD